MHGMVSKQAVGIVYGAAIDAAVALCLLLQLLRHCLLAWRWLCQGDIQAVFVLGDAEDLMRHCRAHASVRRAQ